MGWQGICQHNGKPSFSLDFLSVPPAAKEVRLLPLITGLVAEFLREIRLPKPGIMGTDQATSGVQFPIQ